MRRLHVVVFAVGLALVATGCPPKKNGGGKKPGTSTKPVTKPTKKPTQNPNALPEDKAWAAGKVQGASVELETRVDVKGMGGKGGAVMMTQTMWVTDDRGKVVFTTEKSEIPKGTELRYNGTAKKYVLADPGKKMYWSMTGGQLGNLLEGGPEMTRSNYTIKVTETKEKAKVAGLDTIKSDVELGFEWKVKAKDEKSGKIMVKMAIWHTADAKYKEGWGDTMIALLSIPFQDAAGQAVVDELKKKIKFPVKWTMEVTQQGKAKDAKEKNEALKLVMTATKVEVAELDKAGFAWPPAGFAPATGPYQFADGLGGGNAAIDKDAAGKLPAKKGKKPANVEPVPKKDQDRPKK